MHDERHGCVALYLCAAEGVREHMLASRSRIAQRLARLLQLRYAGVHDALLAYERPVFFVPDETLLAGQARALGIRDERDLYGGVVPYAFAATKAITHPVLDDRAQIPHGWPSRLAGALEGVVLPGFTAFTRTDARRAGLLLLGRVPIRVKRSRGIGGHGQVVIRSRRELDEVLERLDDRELGETGVVLEPNLEDIRTYSVGESLIGGMRIAYFGTQRLTLNHRGQPVYGGSDLIVVRGRLDELDRAGPETEVDAAIRQARRYDAAMARCFPDLFASRRNYDVARGTAADGVVYSGVLEQSWRCGGSSDAEIAAVEAFAADPALDVVEASTCEMYALVDPPVDAHVAYRGVDPEVGALTKYSRVKAHGYAA